MKKLFGILLVACLATSSAIADNTKYQCLVDANAARRAAVIAAETAYRDAKSACNGSCAENCLTTYRTCKSPILLTAQTCLNTAEQTFSNAIVACKASTSCTTNCYRDTAFQTCLAPARAARRTSEAACFSTEKTSIRATCDSPFKACKITCKSQS